MSDADVILRDLWRRGLLLTGSEAGADAAVARVLRSQPNVLTLSEDRRRRLLVLGAGESSRGTAMTIAGGPGEALRLLHESSQRFAWVGREVEQWGEIEASRALGMPKSAVAPLVEESRQRLRAAGHDSATAAAGLREWSRSIDAGPGLERVRASLRGARLRRRILTAVQLLLLFAAMALVAWIGRDLLGVAERERATRALQEALSNPMPGDQSKKAQRERRPGAAGGAP
jgi:hypothetical protein